LDQKCQRWTCQFCATEFLENKDSPNSQFTSSQLIKGYNVVWDICDGTTKLRVEGTFDANIVCCFLQTFNFFAVTITQKKFSQTNFTKLEK
jgi:hypothetical protein